MSISHYLAPSIDPLMVIWPKWSNHNRPRNFCLGFLDKTGSLHPLNLWMCNLSGYMIAQLVKNLPAMQETWVWSLGWKDPLEKGMAIHSSILTWIIPWTVKFMGSQRAEYDWVTFTFTSLSVRAVRHPEFLAKNHLIIILPILSFKYLSKSIPGFLR